VPEAEAEGAVMMPQMLEDGERGEQGREGTRERGKKKVNSE
jgi:hypothetical protein